MLRGKSLNEFVSAQTSKCATTTEFDWHRHPHGQRGRMLIDHHRRLRAAIAISEVEIECGNAMLAMGAFEGSAAIHRFSCVISHIFIIVLLLGPGFGQWVRNLRAGS